MSKGGQATGPNLMGVLGSPVETVRSRLGAPVVERRVGKERWLVYESPDLTLRLRCAEGTAPRKDARGERVASWVASLRNGRKTLRAAAEPLGLWPACAPDAAAEGSGLLRRPLADPATDVLHSLTATIRDGRVVRLAAFDEPPEWLPDECGR